MAIDRRVAEVPTATTAARLDQVPTQRTGPDAPEAPRPDPRRRGRAVTLGVALTATAALLVTTGVVQHQREVRQTERAAAGVRVAAALLVQGADVPDASQVAGQGAWTAALSGAHEATTAAAGAGAQTLAATPHAGDAPRATLQSVVDAAAGLAADPTASLTELTAAAGAVTMPAKTATDAEAAWQAAEQARVAAEQAAAQAAAEAAARKAAAAKAPARQRSTAPSGGTATGPMAIPAGGLVCKGAPVGAGAGESSVGAIGEAINAYRLANGLPALGVQRSGQLVSHAQTMATSGGIWHSGYDNIVGCTSGSVQSLVNAWANSAPHNKQMLRTDVSVMKVGGASSGGWLYGAVKFS